jgi:hypothetical protein
MRSVSVPIARRRALQGLCALALLAGARASRAAETSIVVTKDPNCGCCTGWVAHLRQAGFAVEVRDVPDVNRVKARLGVPADLQACHTAEVAGYVIEGHVPASALRRFLQEKPDARGLAVAGMPVGSPGMEVPNTPPDEYDVIQFGPQRRTYARFRGAEELR